MNVKTLAAGIAAASLLVPSGGGAMPAGPQRVTTAATGASSPAAVRRRNEMIAALRKRVKYVFVLYQENRSFDSYFGTFPKADGIYSAPASQTAGFSQQIENTDGSYSSISPFRIGPAQYAADTDDVDHSHARLVAKMDVTAGGPQMDKFALIEEIKHIPATQTLPTLLAKQYGELAMAHEDCDTVPLLWNYANRFVLFDHIFQSAVGPSTPGNIAIMAAQTGETQAALHPGEAYTDNGNGGVAGVPVDNDRNPAWGPYNPGDSTAPASLQLNLTFASLPLLFAGRSLPQIAAADPLGTSDFLDTSDDVTTIAKRNLDPVRWGWFEEGYRPEPRESVPVSARSYITHHNGPQYFGYVANSTMRQNLYNLGDFESALQRRLLPASGGVAYVKGGSHNIHALLPVDPDPTVQKNFTGDDDHPGYSDAQISEAQVAREINLIAASPYWSQSAIVVTWDDSEGDYDHVAPPLKVIGPGVGNVPQDFISDGPRVPLLVISPFAKTHSVEHAYGDHGSVVKLIEQVFGLGALADLPDEQKGFAAGAYLGKLNYGPDDGNNGVSDLLDAFDHDRLTGASAQLPASYAYVNPYYVDHLPAQTHIGCGSIGVIPVDYLRGIRNVIPADFNPRPATDPTDKSVTPINTRALVGAAHDIDD